MHTTPTRHSGCCGQAGPGQAGAAGTLERPRYFPRQLITPDELTLEADYFRDRMRRHNMYLHGWGVVCGALVVPVPARPTATPGQTATEPWRVRVEPGYILGPYGDEIVIDLPGEVPLRGDATSGGPADPWCGEVYTRDPAGPFHVAVRYQERRTRPVPAQPAGCDCDDLPCEYSRLRDGYEFGVLDHCPGSHRPDAASVAGNPECPACPESPWVVLAEVTVDADGVVSDIDNCSCRRIVASARDDWRRCGDDTATP